MRNWLLTLILAAAVCAGSFAAFYAWNREPASVREAARHGDALEWLRAEFHLTDKQFAAIKTLHEEYGTQCASHCAAIMAAEKRGAPPAEVTALENACVRSMSEHFRAVAALMAPDEGTRYLQMVLPRIDDYDHRGAPNLQARP